MKRIVLTMFLILICMVLVSSLTGCDDNSSKEENEKGEKQKELILDIGNTFYGVKGISQWTIKLNSNNEVYAVLTETGIQDYFGTYEIEKDKLTLTFTDEGHGAGENGNRFPLLQVIIYEYTITAPSQFEGNGFIFNKVTEDESRGEETSREAEKHKIDTPEKAIKRVREYLKLENGNPTRVEFMGTDTDEKGTYYIIQTRASGEGEMPAGALLATFYVYENGDVRE